MGLFGKIFGGGNPEQPPQPTPEQEPTTDEKPEDATTPEEESTTEEKPEDATTPETPTEGTPEEEKPE